MSWRACSGTAQRARVREPACWVITQIRGLFARRLLLATLTISEEDMRSTHRRARHQSFLSRVVIVPFVVLAVVGAGTSTAQAQPEPTAATASRQQYIRLQNTLTGTCLQDEDGGWRNGWFGGFTAEECNDSWNQQWLFEGHYEGTFGLRNRATDRCISDNNEMRDQGPDDDRFATFDCDPFSEPQSWYRRDFPANLIVLENQSTRRCIRHSGDDMGLNTDTCNYGHSAQNWRVEFYER